MKIKKYKILIKIILLKKKIIKKLHLNNESKNKSLSKNKDYNNKKIKYRKTFNNQFNQDNELKFSFSNINFNQKKNQNNSILNFEKLTEEEIEKLIKTYSKQQNF